SAPLRHPPSPPTRRSSDLTAQELAACGGVVEQIADFDARADVAGSGLRIGDRSAAVGYLVGGVIRIDAAENAGMADGADARQRRSEEHTTELQSRENLVCR